MRRSAWRTNNCPCWSMNGSESSTEPWIKIRSTRIGVRRTKEPGYKRQICTRKSCQRLIPVLTWQGYVAFWARQKRPRAVCPVTVQSIWFVPKATFTQKLLPATSIVGRSTTRPCWLKSAPFNSYSHRWSILSKWALNPKSLHSVGKMLENLYRRFNGASRRTTRATIR